MSDPDPVEAELASIQASADYLRRSLQAISHRHVLYTALLLELDQVEADLAEIKRRLNR